MSKSNKIKRLLGLPVEIEDREVFMALGNQNVDALSYMTLSQRSRLENLRKSLYYVVQAGAENHEDTIESIFGFRPQSKTFKTNFNTQFKMWGLEIGYISFLLCLDESFLVREPQLVIMVLPDTTTEELDSILSYLETVFVLVS